MQPGDPIDRLTGSVSDGKPVDWEDVEVGTDLDADTVDAMRDVARIAEFNRTLQRAAPPSAPGHPPGAAGPDRWRDLTLLEPIGAGARGEVWRAWDSTLQRQVALKFLQPSGAPGNDAARADLLAEARALARVRHPGIVTVFGIAEDQGRVGMWMECVPGTTLAREIERVGKLPARHVIQIGLQLCSALEALTKAGLVHRDIKPANILLEGEDRVVLTDFGLGWRPAFDEDAAPRMSGTPLFMAPEIIDGEKPTPRSDLYALGVTLWWALAGQAPFQAKTLSDLRSEVARGPSRSLHSICPEAPPDLLEAILSAMKPSLSERIQSAAELTPRFQAAAQRLQASTGTVSIAVLPFVNRGAGSEDEYFSDGLADELIGMLAKIRGLRVAARASAFSFRGKQATIAEIGRALHVDTVLDGSIRRSGERIRISVQLVKVSDGLHLWSETYDRRLDDIFAVQDDIAHSAVKELRSALLGQRPDSETSRTVDDEVAMAAKGRAANPAAHRLYLLGRHLINRLTREDLTKAIEHLKGALALDPEFALAWAELSGAYRRAASFGLIPMDDAIGLAREAARRALTIEPDLAEAHARIASIQMFHDWNWNAAADSYARALHLAPGDAVSLNGAGVLAMILGRTEEAIALHRNASEQDPLSAAALTNYGLTLYRAGRFSEAETVLRRALELAPQRHMTRSFLARAFLALGRGEEALAEAQRETDDGQRLYVLAMLHHELGDMAASNAAFRELVDAHAHGYAFQIAEVHAVRGEADACFEWLDKAYDERDLGLSELRGNPSFHPVHDDPRWRAMLARLGFEDSP